MVIIDPYFSEFPINHAFEDMPFDVFQCRIINNRVEVTWLDNVIAPLSDIVIYYVYVVPFDKP